MNIIIYSLVIFGAIYLVLKFIVSISSKKLTRVVRFSIFIISLIFSIILAFGGKFLLSLPLILLSLAIVKLKGLSLFQLIALFRLIQTLKSTGRYSFNKDQHNKNSSSLSLEESYKILNLDIDRFLLKKNIVKYRWFFLLGISVGFASMARPTANYYWLILAIIIYSSFSAKDATKYFVICLIGISLFTGSWVVRNYVMDGNLQLQSTSGVHCFGVLRN